MYIFSIYLVWQYPVLWLIVYLVFDNFATFRVVLVYIRNSVLLSWYHIRTNKVLNMHLCWCFSNKWVLAAFVRISQLSIVLNNTATFTGLSVSKYPFSALCNKRFCNNNCVQFSYCVLSDKKNVSPGKNGENMKLYHDIEIKFKIRVFTAKFASQKLFIGLACNF